MKKLAYFYYYANIGGVTSVIKSRLVGLKKRGWKVDAFFEKDVGGIEELRRAGLDDVRVIASLKEKAAELVGNGGYDAVTVFDMPELILPLRAVYNGSLIYEIHTPIDRVLLRSTADDINASTCVLVPSVWSKQWVAEKIRGITNTESIIAMPNIIDRSVFRVAKSANEFHPTKPQLVWVGKVAAYKRWRDAVRVLGRVLSHTDCDLTFITGGEMNEAGTADFLYELEAYGCLGKSRWYYNLPAAELADIYHECRATKGAVLSTSEAESFCLVAHEAFSCGVPVVSAAAGALPEIYKGALSSLLFDVGDVPGAVAILARILGQSGPWESFSRAGLAVQRDFNPEKLAGFYVDVVEKHLLAKKKAG